MSSRILESLLLRRYGDSITDTKQARKVVLEARNNLQANASIIWSKELELECIRLAGISSMRKRKGDSVKSSNPGTIYDISSRKTGNESDQEDGSILPFSTIDIPSTSDLVLEMEDISHSECDDVSEIEYVVVAEKPLSSVNIQQSGRSKFRAQGRSNSFISEKHSAHSKSPSRAETSNSCNTKKLNKSPLVTESLSDENDGIHLPIARPNHSRIKPSKDVIASKSFDEVNENSQKAISTGSNHTTKSKRSKKSYTKSPKTIKQKVDVEGIKPIDPLLHISESKSPSRRQSASRTTKSIAKSTLSSTVQDLINQRGENLANVRIVTRKKRNTDDDTERPQTCLIDLSTEKQTQGIYSVIRRNTASSETSNVTRSPSSGEHRDIKTDDDTVLSDESRGKSTKGSNRLSRKVFNGSKNSEVGVQRNSLSNVQSIESNEAVLNEEVSLPLSSERSSFIDDDLLRNIQCVHNNGSEIKSLKEKSSGRRLMNQPHSRLRQIYRSPTRAASKPVINCIPTEIMFDIDRKEEKSASSDDLLPPSLNLQTPSKSSCTVDMNKNDTNNDKKPLSSCIRYKSSTCSNAITEEKTSVKPILRPAKIRTNKDSTAKDLQESADDAPEGTDVTFTTTYRQPPPRKFVPVSPHLINQSKPAMDCDTQNNTSLPTSKILSIGADGYVCSSEAGMRHPDVEIVLPVGQKPNYDVSIKTPRTVIRSLRNKFEATQQIQEPVSISNSKNTKRQLQREVEDKMSNPDFELKQSRHSKKISTKCSCSPSKRQLANNQFAANDLDLQATPKATRTPLQLQANDADTPLACEISAEGENISRQDNVKNTLQQLQPIDNERAGSLSGPTPVAVEKGVKSTTLIVRTFRQASERTLLKHPVDQNSIVVQDTNSADNFDQVVGESMGKRDVDIGCHPVKTRTETAPLTRKKSFKVDSAAYCEKESKPRHRTSEEGCRLSIDHCIDIQTPSRKKRPPSKNKYLNDKVPVNESNAIESVKGQSEPDMHIEVKEHYYKPSSRRTSSFQRSHSENKIISIEPPSENLKSKSKSLVLESLDESQGEVHLHKKDEDTAKSVSMLKVKKKGNVNFPHSISVDDPKRIREVVCSEKYSSIQRNVQPQHDTLYESTTFSSDDDNQRQCSLSSMEKSWNSESDSEQSLQTDFYTDSNDSSVGSKADQSSHTDSNDESSRRVASMLSRPSPKRFVDNETSGSTTSNTFHKWKLRCTTAETTSDIVRCTTQNKLLSQKKPQSNRYGKDNTVSSKTQKQQPIPDDDDDDDDFDCASITAADFDNNDFILEVGDGFHLVDIQSSSFANLSINPAGKDEKQRLLKPLFGRTVSDRSMKKNNRENSIVEQKESYSRSNDNINEQPSDGVDDEKSQKSKRSKRLVMVPVNAIRKEDLSKFLDSRSTKTTHTTSTTKSRHIGSIENKKLKAKNVSNIVVPGKVEKEQHHATTSTATGSTALSMIDTQNKDATESIVVNCSSTQDQRSTATAHTSIESLSLSQSTLSLPRSLHKTTSSGFWDIETYMDSDDSDNSS